MSGARVYAGRSARERTETRRRKLIDAALESLGTGGWSETTVRKICEQAGLSSRFFYESFDGLDALAVTVFDEIVGETVARVISAVEQAGPERNRQARSAIATMVGELTDDPRRARIVFVEALANEPMARRRMQAMHQLAGVIAMFGRAEYDVPPEAEPLVQITAAMLAGGVAELMIAWLDGRLDVPRDRLIDDSATLVVGLGDTAAALAAAPSRGLADECGGWDSNPH